MPLTSAILSAAPGMLQTGAGLAQTIIGGIGAHRTQRQLEQLPTPTYTGGKGISDYYQEALNRYMASPYASQMYQEAQNRLAQSQAAGINALQDRRMALQGVGALVGQTNRGLNQAGVQAEQLRRQDFGTLGRAAQMKANQDLTAFQYNQMLPYEKRMSILGAKAAGYNKMLSAGLQNMFSGIGSTGQMGSSMSQQGLLGGGGSGGSPYYTDIGLSGTGASGVPSPAASYGTLLNPASAGAGVNPMAMLSSAPLIGI